MQFSVHHQFESLSAEHSGKQHKFSWREWDGDSKQSHFVCYAMYQSGDDKIRTSDGGQTLRGRVARFQFDEDEKTAPGNGIELKVDDALWQAADYQKLAHYMLHECKTQGSTGEPLSQKQKAAMLCQLASLYNLMATQYGVVFSMGMGELPARPNFDEIRNAVDEMVTDRKLKTVSAWFKDIAADLLTGREPQTRPLQLPSIEEKPINPTFGWHHTIDVQAGTKFHRFTFDKLKDPPPEIISDQPLSPNFPYRRLAEAGYTSGPLGERVAVFPIDPENPQHAYMEHGFGLHARLGPEALRQPISPSAVQSLVDPVPVMQNANVINKALEQGNVNQDQAFCAMIMLASLYRLVASRYNSGFGYKPDGDRMTPHYFDDPEEDTDAFAAKAEAFKQGQQKNKTFDVMVEDGAMYTRPILVSNAATLAEFINDGKFSTEADQAIEAAAHLAQGELMGAKENKIPVWSLGRWISSTARIAHR